MLKKGITLVSLVITIVILLILATVAISVAIDSNGLFKRAEEAVDKYNISSEREYLEQNVLLYRLNKVTNNIEETKLGAPLHNKNSINNSTWFVIQLLNEDKQVYGDDFSYIPKGTEVEGYGKIRFNWIINYKTGEVINIGEEKKDYIQMSFNSGISVTDNIALNINPINMSDANSWGKDVEFCNENKSGSEVSGFNGTEIKFDGVDDYLKLENVEMDESDGFTFEFYGKNYGSNIYPLEKSILDEKDTTFANNFRTILELNGTFRCCFSNLPSNSNKADNLKGIHWLCFNEVKNSNNKEYTYITLVANFINNTVKLYSNGKYIAETSCDHKYLMGNTILNGKIPFTVGLMVDGLNDVRRENYSKFDLYSCRLYTRVLSDKEIEDNFNETTSYHNYLIQ